MQKNVYERYGLRSNPFRDLSSETLENVDIFHVTQKIDEELAHIREEVSFKENKVVIGILGGLGAGKTERLLLVANEAVNKNYFYVLRNMSFETKWVVDGILDIIQQQNQLSFLKRLFIPPIWYKQIVKLKKQSKKSYDPEEAGRVIAYALNKNTPAFLLINDFHHLSRAKDAERFLHVLHVLVDHIDAGVMVMISSDYQFFNSLMRHHPSLNQRINRKVVIPALSSNEAKLMIAKRLLEKRLVDDVDPLYPFTAKGVESLNQTVQGNPRQLLKIADIVIDYAAKKRTIMINEDVVRDILALSKNKQLHIEFEEQTPVITPLDSHKIKSQGRPNSTEVSLIENNWDAVSPELSPYLDDWQELIPEDCNPSVGNSANPDKKKITEVAHSKRFSKKNQKQKTTISPKNLSQDIKSSGDLSPQTPIHTKTKDNINHLKMVQIQCPDCSKIFAMQLEDATDLIRCPYCDFMGSIS